MLLPLEEWLQEKARKTPNDFPNRDKNYFDLYKVQKEKFSQHVYPFLNAAMVVMEVASGSTSKRAHLYTDHGLKHVDAVIETTGRLLGCVKKTSKIKLTPYEVYLLLMAILSHDAGNIEGRNDHQFKVHKLLMSGPTKVLDDGFEARQIHDIAASHTSKGLISDRKSKDTISELPRERSYGSTRYHPRRIAALLRFADEICEDQKRVPSVLLDQPEVSTGPSAPYLYFGQSITSVDILKDEQSIRIQFDLSPEHVLGPIRFTNSEGRAEEEFLIDVVLSRLGKIRRERTYCFRFLHGVIEYAIVTAEINVVERTQDGNFKVHPVGIVDLSEADYPSVEDDSFLSRHNDISGSAVKERLSSALKAEPKEDVG